MQATREGREMKHRLGWVEIKIRQGESMLRGKEGPDCKSDI